MSHEPDKWAQRLIDDGTWGSYCAANDLGHNLEVEWNHRGSAA